MRSGKCNLIDAICYENDDVCIAVIEARADVNAVDCNLLTPLHYAAYMGNPVLVRMLLEANANVFALDSNNQSPLHEVSGNEDTIRALLEAKALLESA